MCMLVFYTCIHTYAYALWIEPKGRVDVSTKASRFSCLICCYSCLRRTDQPIRSVYDPQTFIMFFCNTSTNATRIAAFARHPVCSPVVQRSVFHRVHHPVTVFINRGNTRADYGVAIVRVEGNCEMWALRKEIENTKRLMI